MNPNNGLLLEDPLYPGQNLTATNTVYFSSKYPSKVTLPVVSMTQLPKVEVLKEMELAYPDHLNAEKLPHYNKLINKMAQTRRR